VALGEAGGLPSPAGGPRRGTRHTVQDSLLELEETEAQQPERLDRGLLPLHLERDERLQSGGALEEPTRVLARQDGPGLGELLQAGRQVGGVP